MQKRQQQPKQQQPTHTKPHPRATRSKPQPHKQPRRTISTRRQPHQSSPALTVSNNKAKFSTTTMSSSPDSSPELGSKVKVYTKTGDKGTTTLYNMQRLSKTSDYFDALGNTDEINSQIGLSREYFIQIPKVAAWRTQNPVGEEFRLNSVVNIDQKSTPGSNKDEVIDMDVQLQIIQSRLLDVGSWYVDYNCFEGDLM